MSWIGEVGGSGRRRAGRIGLTLAAGLFALALGGLTVVARAPAGAHSGAGPATYPSSPGVAAAAGTDGPTASPTGTVAPTPTHVPSPNPTTSRPPAGPVPSAAQGPARAPALSGAGVDDPASFGTWRGTPVQVWETWNNFTTWSDMLGLYTVHANFTAEGGRSRFPGAMSFAQPMWAAGESAGTCNSGVNDTSMRTIFSRLKAAWGPDAYVRLGWEFDGYWFPQNYAPADPTGWVNCWRRWYGIIKGVSPGFELVWNPNWNANTNGHGDFDVRSVWPGDQYVDAAGPDYYDFGINPDSTGSGGQPVGINPWLAFVAAHHKPLAVPEWGLHTTTAGDDPGFIQQLYDAFQRARNSSTGLAYQSYFDLEGCMFELTDGCNPNAAARYRQLF